MPNKKDNTICVIGLGTIGLPLAREFARKVKVIGYDVDSRKKGLPVHQGENLFITDDPRHINKADFVLIAVPTPLTRAGKPDLSFLRSASRAVAGNLKPGATIVVESTVYPGATEEVVKPIIEKAGHRCGKDFSLGCSPERVNPGDEDHGITTVWKVVGGADRQTTDRVAALYSLITPNVFKAGDIRTAEAAKLVENIQRDVNIALMNELALLLGQMGIDTREVIEAASTKWNFLKLSPGMVGGYCIPVSPRYMLYKATSLGFPARLISLAREINDSVPGHVAEMVLSALRQRRKHIQNSKVLVLGLTYKENVPEVRYSPVRDVVRLLKKHRLDVYGYDPLVKDGQATFGIKSVDSLAGLKDIDCVVLATAHDEFKKLSPADLAAITGPDRILIDVRGMFNEAEARAAGFYYRNLSAEVNGRMGAT